MSKHYKNNSTKEVPLFIMPIGIPGSGKSRWITEAFNDQEFIIVHPDKIREEVTGSISNVSQDDTVWRLAKERVIEALEKGKNVILDATNVNGRNRRIFIQNLPVCKLQAKIFRVSPKKAKKRIREDIKNNINRSHVPEEIVDKMYNLFKTESKLKQLKNEGFEIIE